MWKLDYRRLLIDVADQEALPAPLHIHNQPTVDWMLPRCLVDRNEAPTSCRLGFRYPHAAIRRGTRQT